MFTRRFSRALVLGTSVALLMASLAFADNAVSDGDGVTPVADHDMAFGTIDCGVESSKTALIAISRNGSATGTNAFANNTSVSVSIQSVSGIGLTAQMGSPSVITLPGNWTELSNNTLSSSVASTVKITSSTEGAGSGSVTYRATGINTSGERINRDDAMGVTWTTGDCTPVDTTPPSISYVLSPASPGGTNGWYRSDVTLTWTVTENESPLSLVKTGCIDQNITADQAATTYSCSATSDGGSAGPVDVTIKRDATAPSVAYTNATPPANAAGWNNTDVVATFTATDNPSGFGDPVSLTATDTATSSGEGTAVTVDSPAFTDNAGNTAPVGTDSHDFKIDLTDPSVAITSPADGLSTIASTVTVSGTASDTPSGIASVTVNGGAASYDSSAGTFSKPGVALACGPNNITAVATDVADRTSTSPSITVNRICFSGLQYYQPLDQSTGSAPIINKGKYGRVIPTKVTFSILGGDVVTDAIAAANGWTLQIGINSATCSSGAASDTVEAYADAGSSAGGTNLFRWDATGQQWIYNLDTKAPAGVTMVINSCYRLDVYVSDGTNKVKISTTTYAIFQPIK